MFRGYQEDYVALLEGKKTASPEVHEKARNWAEKEVKLLADCIAGGGLSDDEVKTISLDLRRLREALVKHATPDLFDKLEDGTAA